MVWFRSKQQLHIDLAQISDGINISGDLAIALASQLAKASVREKSKLGPSGLAQVGHHFAGSDPKE